MENYIIFFLWLIVLFFSINGISYYSSIHFISTKEAMHYCTWSVFFKMCVVSALFPVSSFGVFYSFKKILRGDDDE